MLSIDPARRAVGFYWLFQDDKPPTVAYFDGGFWTIIGSKVGEAFVIAVGDQRLEKYRVGPKIEPPATASAETEVLQLRLEDRAA